MIAIQNSLWRAECIAAIELEDETVAVISTRGKWAYYGFDTEDEARLEFMKACEKWKRELEGART